MIDFDLIDRLLARAASQRADWIDADRVDAFRRNSTNRLAKWLNSSEWFRIPAREHQHPTRGVIDTTRRTWMRHVDTRGPHAINFNGAHGVVIEGAF